jgi:alkylated DNA nucleotide flippase Atl1
MKSDEDKQYHKKLLELEGIKFSDEFKIELKKYLWDIESIKNI